MTDDPVLLEHRDGPVAVVTLNRPRVRNALNAELRSAISTTLRSLDADESVLAVVLTGSDPAFCAGLDLAELEHKGLGSSDDVSSIVSQGRGPFPSMTTPVIGAINGAAITGGFEIALACDFLVASEHARFADTHARVGIMPGWGLTVALPEAIGVRRALEMSETGNFIDAQTALVWGLVNRVVPHDSLMSTAVALAHDIAGNDTAGVAEIRSIYLDGLGLTRAEQWDLELSRSTTWLADRVGGDMAERRAAVTERGRSQVT